MSLSRPQVWIPNLQCLDPKPAGAHPVRGCMELCRCLVHLLPSRFGFWFVQLNTWHDVRDIMLFSLDEYPNALYRTGQVICEYNSSKGCCLFLAHDLENSVWIPNLHVSGSQTCSRPIYCVRGCVHSYLWTTNMNLTP